MCNLPMEKIDELQKSLDTRTRKLTEATRLLNELGCLSKMHPESLPKEEFMRAIHAACMNFGVEASAYADVTEELDQACGLPASAPKKTPVLPPSGESGPAPLDA